MPPFPRESACSNVPSATYVMPSMSRCGCIGHAAPGTRRSSLNTRRSPMPMLASSQYWSKLKCQFALNQPPSAWNNDARGRRTIVIAKEKRRLGRGGPGYVRLELLEELLFGVVPHDAIGLAAVLEEDHRRDRTHAEATRRDGIGVDVELGDLHFLALLARDLFKHRGNHPTGAAPGRPEIDEHRRLGFDDFRLEVLVADYLWLAHGQPPVTT